MKKKEGYLAWEKETLEEQHTSLQIFGKNNLDKTAQSKFVHSGKLKIN